MYQKELQALKKANRFRQRDLADSDLIDLGTNDYLGLASNKKQFKKGVKLLGLQHDFAPKASMLVGGYHTVHALFEREVALINGFEKGIMLSSGFLANIALIETLIRRGDYLLIDEDFHASGILATRLIVGRCIFFRHNDPEDLIEKLKKIKAKRIFIAVEGVYSMSGELCKKEIFEIAEAFGAVLIVDEAHSSGILGKKLLGIFDHYGITPNENHIKMGTLGKAYGSHGAYVLASSQVISFLENRAKPLIYSTAPSLFDAALALVNLRYIFKNAKKIRYKIEKRYSLIEKILGFRPNSMIVPVEVNDNKEALQMQAFLRKKSFFVGAIRQPTVNRPIIRLIPRVSVSVNDTKKALKILRSKCDSLSQD